MHSQRLMAFCLAGLLSSLVSVEASTDKPDRYWQLGAGTYFGGLRGDMTKVDVARFDWMFLCFGNVAVAPVTVDQLNRMLAINPRLKIVIRVWPIGNLGDCDQNHRQATFLHYLYAPGVREKVLAGARYQIRLVLDRIAKPENVVGATFLEELPLHFTGAPFHKNATGDTVSWDLERFRKEIEAERGKPLRWDDDTRRWWGRKWCQVMDEIHGEMKRALDGRMVFYYQQTNHASIDMVPEGTPLDKPMLMPIRWTDIIKPGLCDGFFAYANNRTIWDSYLRLAKEHHWYFFSQVAHPPYRMSSWPDHMEMAKTRIPQNLGYFFYCEGDCAASKTWTIDAGIPPGPEWNTSRVSIRRHTLRHLALEQVGVDVLQRQPALRLYLDLPLEKAVGTAWLRTRVVVVNRREPEWYRDPAEAVARKVTLTLSVPEGFSLDPRHSPPASIAMGDLAPGERRAAEWWVSVKPGFTGEPSSPFVLTGKTDGSPATVISTGADTAPPFGQPCDIGVSGTEWLESPFRLSPSPVKPRIVIDVLAGPVRHPAVGEGNAVIAYEGVLESGTRLVLDPNQGARLFALPLVDDDGAARADAADPSGFKPFDKDYVVVNSVIRRPIRGGTPLRITVEGKGVDGAQSFVNLHFTAKGQARDVALLANRFSSNWQQVNQTVRAPDDADTLDRIYLYRFGQKGKVWYGPLRVDRTDIGDAGRDVSPALRGAFPSLSATRFHVFRYTDDELPSLTPRVRVQLVVPE